MVARPGIVCCALALLPSVWLLIVGSCFVACLACVLCLHSHYPPRHGPLPCPRMQLLWLLLVLPQLLSLSCICLATFFDADRQVKDPSPPSAFEKRIHHAAPRQHAVLNMAKCLTDDADSSRACVSPAAEKSTKIRGINFLVTTD